MADCEHRIVNLTRSRTHSTTTAPRRAGRALLLAALLVATLAGRPARCEDAPAVARVDDKTLTEAEFHHRCELYVGGVSDTAVGLVVVREWIQQTLAEKEASNRNLLPSREEVDHRVKALRKQFELRGEEFESWLTTHGRTLDTFREDTRQQLIAEHLMTDGINVSDVEVQLYYTNNKSVLGVPEQLKVSRLTLDDKKAAGEVADLLKKGASFEQLARERSIDPYKSAGGHMAEGIDAIPKSRGALEPPVLDRALKLDKGQVAGPIKADNHWVFVRLDDRVPARVPELSDVQDLLAANLRVQKGGPDHIKKAQARLDQLVREAKIEIYRPEYQGLLKQLHEQNSVDSQTGAASTGTAPSQPGTRP